jgi:hypothetical protein
MIRWIAPDRTGAVRTHLRRTSVQRSSAVLLTLLMSLVACAGCSSPVAGSASPAPQVVAAAPEARSCWQDSTPGRGSPLDETELVICSEPHDAETIVANDDVFAPEMAYPTLTDLAKDPTNRQHVVDICNGSLVDGYLGMDVQTQVPSYGLYVTTAPRLPTAAQWDVGARWIRCDVVYGMQSGAPAPGTMAGALIGPESAAYHLCFTGTSDDYDPVGCDQPHDAEALGQPYRVDLGTPWPGAASARQELRTSCAGALPYELSVHGLPAGTQLDVFVGPEESWDAMRVIACVLRPPAGGRTTTTLIH